MANWNTLKAAIANVIKTNGNQEITGKLLQNVLTNVVTSVGENATFAGIATPTTSPGTSDGPVFYLASTPGTYSNFDSIIVKPGSLSILTNDYSGAWHSSEIKVGQNNYCMLSPISAFDFSVNGNIITIKIADTTNTVNVVDEQMNIHAIPVNEHNFTLNNYDSLIIDIESDEFSVISNYHNNTHSYALVAYNEGGEIVYGFLQQLSNLKKFFAEEDILQYSEAIASAKITDNYIDSDGAIKHNNFFDIYEFEIKPEYTKLAMYVATGGGFIAIKDSDDSILYTKKTGYISEWVLLNVPKNATKLQVSYVKQPTVTTSYPIRVMFNNYNVRASSCKWSGKKMLCIGDSITDYGQYVRNLACLLDIKTVYNRGLSGTTVADSEVDNSFCERIDLPTNDGTSNSSKGLGLPSEADIVFVFGGTNDWGRLRGQTLGTLDSQVNRTTFYGALHYVLRNLRLKYGNAKIYVLNLLHYYGTQFKDWNEIKYTSNTETGGFTYCTNNSGKTLQDYRDAINEVSNFYGIDVIDLSRCGMSFFNEEDRKNYTADGLHPNEAGGKLIAEYIYSKIVK